MGFLFKVKRRIAIVFIVLVALSSVPAVSYAETGQVTTDTTTILTAAEYENIAKEAEEKAARTNDPVDIENARKARETANAAAAKAQDASANISAQGSGVAGSTETCGLTNLVTQGLAQCIVKVVGSAILALANFLLGIAGTLLNWVVIKTVFQFGSTIGNSPGVLIAWGIFRDIGNLILLFGFIFMGIATILNTNTFSAKKALPSLLVFAVLMNFSLFAAEAIIDGTNAVTSVMYAQANSDACLGGSSEGPVQAQGSGSQVDNGGSGSLSDCAINYGLAGHIMQSTGLSTMWQTNGSFSAEFFTYIGLALFATIGAVVMIAASIMLVIRLVTLTFVMVAAPIGFAGFAVPAMRGFAKQWWNKLISQAIFAPVLFLLILVSLKITDSFSGSYNERGLAGALTQPDASVMGIVMIFVIVIGFLVASLMAARTIGAQGANFAINSSGKLVGRVMGGAVFGGTGFAGRQTIGRASSSLRDSDAFRRFAQKRPNQARLLGGVLDKGAGASFDARGFKGLQSAAKAGNLDIGKAGKDASKGYKGKLEADIKKRVEFEKNLKPTDEQKGVVTELQKELDELNKAQEGFLKPYFDDIQKKRELVVQARKSGDKAMLDAARNGLRDSIKEYNTQKNSEKNPFNEGRTKDKKGNWKKDGKGDQLQKEIKAWDAIANKEKTDTFAENLTKDSAIQMSFTTDRKAAEQIKKAKPKGIDGALAALKDEIGKKDDESGDDSGSTPTPSPSPSSGTPGSGGGTAGS